MGSERPACRSRERGAQVNTRLDIIERRYKPEDRLLGIGEFLRRNAERFVR